MGTSGRRTPPAPVSAGPRGHPDRLSRQAKNYQIVVWFQDGKQEFFGIGLSMVTGFGPSTDGHEADARAAGFRHEPAFEKNFFSSILKICAVFLSGFLSWRERSWEE